MESNIGYTELHELLVAAGDRRKVGQGLTSFRLRRRDVQGAPFGECIWPVVQSKTFSQLDCYSNNH